MFGSANNIFLRHVLKTGMLIDSEDRILHGLRCDWIQLQDPICYIRHVHESRPLDLIV